MELEKEIFREEGVDLRFFFLRFIKSIWIVIVAALAGAAICAGGYSLYRQINPSVKEYQAITKYYIDFAEDSTGIGYGYYNDYTWNDLMKSDAVLEYTMTLLPETIAKETVEDAVEADIISDVRLLTITVVTDKPELTEEIAKATAKSLQHFPEEIKEIDGIRVIREEAAEEILLDNKIRNYTLFGFSFGAVLAFFVLWLLQIMDFSVYLPKDIEKRFGLPVLGVFYKDEKTGLEAEDGRQEFFANADYLLRGRKKIALAEAGKDLGRNADFGKENTERLKRILESPKLGKEAEIFDGTETGYETLRQADGVVICFSYGGRDAKLAERLLSDLKKQDCNVVAAVLCNADRKMYDRYYYGRARKTAQKRG